MTVVAASGDAGAAGCDVLSAASHGTLYSTHGLAVDFPASSANVTGVGGTALNQSNQYWNPLNNSANGSAVSYIPESAWNDAGTPISGASGGGASILVPKPNWQTGQGVPVDSARDVPDVAFAASIYNDGLLVCVEGSCTNGFLDSSSTPLQVGGTSAAAPPFAGILALVIQKHSAGGRLGNINPNLYSLGQIPTNVFHDILFGTNQIQCQAGTPDCGDQTQVGFQAGPGYDQVTGWGSVDAYNFAEQWYGDIQVAVNPTVLTIQPGTSANATVTLSPQNNFSGPVTFTCSVASALVDVTCSIPNATVNTSGTTTVVISAASTARTPFFRGFPVYPPLGLNWRLAYLTVLLLLLLATIVMYSRGPESFYKQPSILAHSILLLAIAAGAVSCGGAGSAPVLGNKGSSAPTQPPALTLSCNLPNNATTGVAYSGSCTASGGTGAVTFSLSSGVLPAGLSLNALTGAITGTPTSSGIASFTVKVTDSGSPVQTATQAETNFNVSSQTTPLVLTCNLPANANNATMYSGTCSASGGTSPFIFSVSAGTLPVGLSLNTETGNITGQPTTIGTSSFTLQVVDSGTPVQTTTQAVTNFRVVAGPLSLLCPLENFGHVASAYSSGCSTIGGTPPFTYAITAGALPLGLKLDPATGVIAGVPVSTTKQFIYVDSTFTVSVSDSSSPALSATQAKTISIGPIYPIGVNCPASPPAFLGVSLNTICGAYGGNFPYTSSIVQGALPPGLSLDPTQGRITGTPAAMGSYSFTIQFQDSSSPPESVQGNASIIVGPRPSETGLVTITATSGGIVNTQTISVTVP